MDTTDPHALLRLHARIAGIRTIAGQGEHQLDRAEALLARMVTPPPESATDPRQAAVEVTELVREARRILCTILEITRPMDRGGDV